MPGRIFSPGGYRYGFNGKENDNEVKNVPGSQLDYGMRVYDPRLGRFLSVDPLTQAYAWLTPYQYAANRPIWCSDLDGLESLYRNGQQTDLKAGLADPKEGDIYVALNNTAQSVYNGGQWIASYTLTEISINAERQKLTLDLDGKMSLKDKILTGKEIKDNIQEIKEKLKLGEGFTKDMATSAVGEMIQQAATNQKVKVPIVGGLEDDAFEKLNRDELKASFSEGYDKFTKMLDLYNKDAKNKVSSFYMTADQYSDFQKNGTVNTKDLSAVASEKSSTMIVIMESDIKSDGNIDYGKTNSLTVPDDKK